jgi:hypothetical protein
VSFFSPSLENEKKKLAFKKKKKKFPDPPKTTFTPSQPSLLLFFIIIINICYDNMVINIKRDVNKSVKVVVKVVNVRVLL